MNRKGEADGQSANPRRYSDYRTTIGKYRLILQASETEAWFEGS